MHADRVGGRKHHDSQLSHALSGQEPAPKKRKTSAQAPLKDASEVIAPTKIASERTLRKSALKESSQNMQLKASRSSKKSVSVTEAAGAEPLETSENEDTKVSKDVRAQRKREAREKRRHQEAGSTLGEKDEERAYIAYLRTYHHDRPKWKFNKALQTTLLRDCLNLHRVPPELDEALLEYIGGLQGQGARIRLAEEARKVLDEPDSQKGQLPGTDDMKYSRPPADLSPKDAEEWTLHMENKRKFYERWKAGNAPGDMDPEAKAKKKDFEEYMARLRKIEATEENRKQEHHYNALRRNRAQQVFDAVSVLMKAMITEERQKRDQTLAAAGKPTRPKNDEFAPNIVNRNKKSRGRKRRTAATESISSSSSSSSGVDSSDESSDSD